MNNKASFYPIADLSPLFGQPSTADSPLIIAGPCSAESYAQVDETASLLSESGIKVFRAGAWKPRTKPGCFEGYGSKALDWIASAGSKYGMQTVTEVANPRHLQEAVDAGINGVWLGARTVVNPFAVQDIADSFAALDSDIRKGISVLVKNPVNPDLELWAGAIQRLFMAGIRRLGAIHRGFSAYGESRYRNSPMWRIPIELHRRYPDLPLICDPSHIAGRRDLILPLCREACNIGFNGLMIEVHVNPDCALSDAAQQITPDSLAGIIPVINRKPGDIDTDTALGDLRAGIDILDRELIDILARRMKLCDKVGAIKKANNIPVLQPGRYRNLMERLVEEGNALGLNDDFLRNLFATIHEESVRRQL